MHRSHLADSRSSVSAEACYWTLRSDMKTMKRIARNRMYRCWSCLGQRRARDVMPDHMLGGWCRVPKLDFRTTKTPGLHSQHGCSDASERPRVFSAVKRTRCVES